jgi:hypothetical protein
MDVEMADRLAAIGTGVHDQTISGLGQPDLVGHLDRKPDGATERQLAGIAIGCCGVGKVGGGDHQQVDRGLGIEVVKRQRVV